VLPPSLRGDLNGAAATDSGAGAFGPLAGAIAVLVALLYVLPGIVAALPASIEHTVEEFWPTQAGQEVTVVLLFAFVIMTRRDA
jgi:hypothetical protein